MKGRDVDLAPHLTLPLPPFRLLRLRPAVPPPQVWEL